MPAATITSKGQLTLPKQIRDRLGVGVGDRVAFRERPDGTVVLEPETLDLLSLKGTVRPRARGVSLEDMDAAIRRAVTRRHRRQRR
jgi:antitoxin PrlF